MAAVDVKNKESNYYNHSTGLLVSILLRYPEIGTISCSKEAQTITFKFLISPNYNYELLKEKLKQALEIYHSFEGGKMEVCLIEKLEQEVNLLAITRDIVSLNFNEVNLIVEFLKNELKKDLIIDEIILLKDEVLFQEDVINHLLANIRINGTENNITAIREDGRVLVFNG